MADHNNDHLERGFVYDRTCNALPRDTPIDFPHVIYLRSFHRNTSTEHLRLCDGVATVLWNLGPRYFRQFFDYRVHHFEMTLRTGDKSRDMKVFIGRKGHEVVAGTFLGDDTLFGRKRV